MFTDRKDAGIQLGAALERYRTDNPLLLAIPRGGVEVGYYAAQHLNGEFNVIISRKLGHPNNPEAAFGALAEDGSIYLNPLSNKFLSKEIIESVVRKEEAEIERRIDTYRDGEALSDIHNRLVILIDDGIATGATLFAAVKMCKKLDPEKLVIAAPVSGSDIIPKLRKECDELIILDIISNYFAVSQGYRNFYNLTDREVIDLMKQWRKHKLSQT